MERGRRPGYCGAAVGAVAPRAGRRGAGSPAVSLSWLLLGIALALIRLGSPGSLRLAGIAGDSPADGARWRVDLRGAESAGPAAAVITGGLVALRTGPALGLAAALGVSTATTLL